MPRLSIPETRELFTLDAVDRAGPAGASIVHQAGPAEIAGATAEALSGKGYVEIQAGKPRHAMLTPAGIARLNELRILAGKVEGKAWCVQHRDGWCATADGKCPDEDATAVATRCEHEVTLPWSSQYRAPDCGDCKSALAAGR